MPFRKRNTDPATPAGPSSSAGVLGAALWLSLSACGGFLGAATNVASSGTLVVPMAPSGRQQEPPQLFRMNPDGTERVQLTQGTGAGLPTDANDFPVLARDRKTILFASGRDFQPDTKWNLNPMRRMAYVMDAAGGKAHRLTRLDPEHNLEYPNDMAPDGTWAVLAVVNDGTNVTAGMADHSKLYRAELDGASCTLLMPDDPLSKGDGNLDCAVFTADGKTLVFTADGPTALASEIWKLDLATLKTTQVTHEGEQGAMVSWRRPMVAPGDGSIYFTTVKQDFSAPSLKRIQLDGTGETEVLSAGEASTLDWFALAPDGKALACAHAIDDSRENLITLNLDGQDMKILYPDTTFIGWGSIAWR